ncbi:uncharacterized protein Tco025E_02052 [Trypanosoma conorhini]|uniref:Starter acyltransferase (SAT) domain-containing protein n=1 Tax=Trypanosoma conorhini TaxID=83891 RepID=A0A3R7N5D5_9TRYP|nr:uncharacterized protein Tco025E_02052 [Trypanosoma conorhini]RNF25670.1 hypothetical protein Tco025E_02052 [Trypanosoma conorhini]
MHARGSDDPDRVPDECGAGVPGVSAEGNDHRDQAVHVGPASAHFTGLFPTRTWRAEATTWAADASSWWRLFGLPIVSRTLSGAASCYGMSRGPSVRRVAESHAALVTGFVHRNFSPSLTAGVRELAVREPALCDVTVLGDGVEAEHRRQRAAAHAEEQLEPTVPLHGGQCTPPGAKVASAPSRPSPSAASEAAQSALQTEPVKPSSTQSTEHDAPKFSVSDSREENVSCLQDVLQEAALAMSSLSAEEVLLPQRIASLFAAEAAQRVTVARRRKRGIFGLFGNIDQGYFEAFARVFRRNQGLLEEFLERVLQSTPDRYAAKLGVMDILRLECGTLDDQFFIDPLVAWPMQLLYEVSCFYVTARRHGYHNTFEAMRRQGGVFASGKGLFAALAVAMSPTAEELVQHTAQMFQAACIVGLVYSKLEMQLKVQVQKCGQRRFSLLLVNISTISLQLLLDEVNKVDFGSSSGGGGGGNATPHCIPMSRLEMTRVISSHSAIVCGHPLDLERLSTLLFCYADATGLRVHVEYLRTTVPENSPFYNQWQHLELLHLWKDSAVELDAARLQLTLYSPVDGQPWNRFSTCALADRVAMAVTYALQDLTCSLRHMRCGDVLLDFSASALCMSHLIACTRGNITMLSQPADCVSRCALTSPRRSPDDGVLRSTLASCARINTILQSMQWEGKPRQACVLSLTMSFADLGLLVSAEAFSTASSVPHWKGRKGESKFPRTFATRSPRSGVLADFILSLCDDAAVSAENDAWASAIGAPSAAAAAMPIHYLALPNENFSVAMDIYHDSPVVRYYEMQCNCFLTRGAVEFTRRLSLCTGIAFPPHTLLMCPTVLSLMELLDTYEFLGRRAPDED